MPPSTTRRDLLRAVTALAAGTSIAGCNQQPGTDATTRTPATTTSSTVAEPRAIVGVERESYLAKAWTLPQDRYRFPKGEAVALADLPSSIRDAVRTAIESPPYSTTDASNAFLDAIDDVDLVEHDGIIYDVAHTFPTVTIRLDTDISGNEPTESRTAQFESEAVESSEAVEDLVYTIAPHGVETEPAPYETTRLHPDIRDFLGQYDYVESPVDVGEIVVSRTDRTPPHTVRAQEATDEDLYGREIREVSYFGPPTRNVVQRLLASERKTPGNYQDRIHTLYLEDVPREFARSIDHDTNYLRVDDGIYGFDTRHVHWSELPLEFGATVAGDNTAQTGPVDVTLTVENTTDDSVQLQMAGLEPFGVLWAYGPGGEHVLWNDAYDQSEDIVIEDGRVVPESHDEFVLPPGQSRSATYRLGHDNLGATSDLQSGTYEVLGTIWARWPTYEGAKEYDWRSQLFPYTLTIEVS